MRQAPADPFQKGIDFRAFLLNALLILPPAFLYSMKTDMPHIILITTAILLICLFKRSYLPYSDRPIIYCVTAALVLTVVPDMVVTVDDARFGLFDLMLRSSLAVPMLLYSAALSCFFPPNPHRTGLTAAFALAAILICGDIFNSADLTNNILSFLDVPLRNYRTTYAVTVVIQALALPFYFYTTTKSIYPAKAHKSASATRFLIRFLCIALIPLFAFSVSKFYYTHASFFRNLEFYFLRVGMSRQMRGGDMMILSNSVNLNATMQASLLKNPDKVLIRAKAEAPPGYLRGGGYTKYRKGEWLSNASRTPLQSTRRATILSENTFTVQDFPDAPKAVPDDPRELPPEPVRRVELYFDGLVTRGVVPVPGNTYRLDAVADDAEITNHGIFSLKLWKNDGGCTFFVTGYDPQAAYPAPVPDKAPEQELTEVPRRLRPVLEQFARKIQAGKRIRRDRDKLAAVIDGLSRYRYSLDFQPPGDGTDPVVHFLTEERKGHCELFATSAVLLLRSMGLPARYVTGLICEERHPYSQYYIARASNVHAWGEVYLADEKRWVLVEATPPSGDLPSARNTRKQGTFSSVLDLLKQTFQQAFADVRRGYFADAVLTVIEAVSGFLPRLLRHPAVLAVLLLSAAVLLYRYFSRRNRKRHRKRLNCEVRLLSAAFVSFERKYAAQFHKKRPKEQTLQSFYADAPREIREYIAEYEAMRYREQPPEPDRVRSFAARGKLLLKNLPKR